MFKLLQAQIKSTLEIFKFAQWVDLQYIPVYMYTICIHVYMYTICTWLSFVSLVQNSEQVCLQLQILVYNEKHLRWHVLSLCPKAPASQLPSKQGWAGPFGPVLTLQIPTNSNPGWTRFHCWDNMHKYSIDCIHTCISHCKFLVCFWDRKLSQSEHSSFEDQKV